LNDISPTTKVHPESDSFSYIQQIVMALHSLSQVHRAMDTITQRLPVEVYQLVDKTIQEIELRRQIDWQNIKGKQKQSTFDTQSSGGGNGFMKSEKDAEILADLMWSLYSKLAAVLSGHRVVHDCVLKIVKESKNSGGGVVDKENLMDTPEFNYIEVWKPIQSEVQLPSWIRQLIVDTLITVGLSNEQCSCHSVSAKHISLPNRPIQQTQAERRFQGFPPTTTNSF